MIAIGWGFLCWRILGVAPIIAIVLILPVSGPLLALGLIRREGQSFETYFVAMIRFMLVPRRRQWYKDDAKVIIKEPEKKPVDEMPSGHNPAQIRGELRKLATIVDSRGRIPKGADVQAPDANIAGSALSQRVVTPEATQVAGEIIATKVAAPRSDMLDMQHNPQAVAVGELLKTSSEEVRAQAVANMQKAATEPTRHTSSQAQAPSQAPSQNAILQRAVQNGSDMSVQQISEQVNRPNVLQPGQSAQIRQAQN